MLGSGRISSCLLRVRGSSTALIVNVPMSSSELNIAVHPTSFGESQPNPKGKKWSTQVPVADFAGTCKMFQHISHR
jgi:hypothetical protein